MPLLAGKTVSHPQTLNFPCYILSGLVKNGRGEAGMVFPFFQGFACIRTGLFISSKQLTD
jgi:hypothetical protein